MRYKVKVTEVLMLILFMGSIFGFDNLQGKSVQLNVYNISQTNSLLTFEYELRNNSKLPIWICQYISIYDRPPLQYEIQVNKDKKIVKVRQASFKVPKNILLEEPIVARYIRVRRNESYIGQVKLKLPLEEINPLNLNRKASNYRKKYVAEKVIFEIGIIKKDLINLPPSDLYHRVSSNEIDVNCFWPRKIPELILNQVVENIAVSYCE